MRPFSQQNLEHDLEDLTLNKNRIEILIDELSMLTFSATIIYLIHLWSKL